MARLNRIGNIERLIMALREVDGGQLRGLESYGKFLDRLRDYKGNVNLERDVLWVMADLIEEAMETEGFNLR